MNGECPDWCDDIVRLSDRERSTLLELGRRSISHGLERGELGDCPSAGMSDSLLTPVASFVTLHCAAELRGCCGSIEARRPLAEDVWHNAYASAFRDPRFPPLRRDECAALEFEITLLSPLQPIDVSDESELLRRLIPGVDGLVLEFDGERVTFLPKVWESLPSPAEFVNALKRKAGWSPDFWSRTLRCSRYRVQSFHGGG